MRACLSELGACGVGPQFVRVLPPPTPPPAPPVFTGSKFDTYLALYNANTGALISENDDCATFGGVGPNPKDACIVDFRADGLLAGVPLLVVVGDAGGGRGGSYTLEANFISS
jgi:hypothetical protein